MSSREDRRYTRDHEWLRLEGDLAAVGITDYAASQLGDIVYVELPAVGTKVTQAAAFGTVESVKAVSDLYAPVSGEIVEINAALATSPETVTNDPFGDGWIARIRITDPAEVDALLPPDAYRTLVEA